MKTSCLLSLSVGLVCVGFATASRQMSQLRSKLNAQLKNQYTGYNSYQGSSQYGAPAYHQYGSADRQYGSATEGSHYGSYNQYDPLGLFNAQARAQSKNRAQSKAQQYDDYYSGYNDYYSGDYYSGYNDYYGYTGYPSGYNDYYYMSGYNDYYGYGYDSYSQYQQIYTSDLYLDYYYESRCSEKYTYSYYTYGTENFDFDYYQRYKDCVEDLKTFTEDVALPQILDMLSYQYESPIVSKYDYYNYENPYTYYYIPTSYISGYNSYSYSQYYPSNYAQSKMRSQKQHNKPETLAQAKKIPQ